jgi:dTDP-4-dehydrorhamnose reductase
MKVLLTGGSGQLGRALIASRPKAVELIAPLRDELDLSSPGSIERCFQASRPNLVINAGAYTAVDQAESDRELAFAVNSAAPASLAKLCELSGARLLHISTDFVFDGKKSSPYLPDDEPNPLSVYGASKLAGERAIMGTNGLHWHILRTAWVYAPQGRNFMLAMLRLFRERPMVNVVSDQIGSPTSADALATCVWRFAMYTGRSDLFHFASAGVASWYDFAVAIYEEARQRGLVQNVVQIKPITADQYPSPTRRPSYSVLGTGRTHEVMNSEPQHWRESLRAVLGNVLA